MSPINRALWAIQLTVVLVAVIGTKPKDSSSCHTQQSTLTCAAGEIIAIRSVEYGARKIYDHPCHYVDGDCRYTMESEISALNILCSGHTDCLVETTIKQYSPTACPGDITVYRTIHYECIEENETVRICTDNSRVGKQLFVLSPEYPDLIKGDNSKCICHVRTTASADIVVNAVDMRLTGLVGHNKCQQQITLSNVASTKTFDCLKNDILYGFREIHRAKYQHVELKFLSTAENATGRFFFGITAIGGHSLTITCLQQGFNLESVESSPVSPGSTDKTPKNDQPDGVLIGGIVAAVLFVAFIATLVIMIIRHRKRRLERQSSQRAMDIKHGVVDPFLLSNDSGSGHLSQNAPAHPELVYAIPGYSQPYDGHGVPVHPQVSPDKPASHYTYIAPDIIDTTGFQQVRNKKPPVPVPRIPSVPPVVEDKNGNMPYLVRNQPDVTGRRISQRSSNEGNE